MKTYPLTYLAWISLVFLAAVSCSPVKYLSGEQPGKIRDSIFSDSFKKMTLKADVIYKEKEISGLLLIKNAGEGNYKIAFYNELGMTYLEGILENHSNRKKIVVKNITPVLNHKLFIKNFKKSMEIVLTYKPNPRHYTSMPSCPHASKPPSLQASKPQEKDESILIVKLRNGFRLELLTILPQNERDSSLRWNDAE